MTKSNRRIGVPVQRISLPWLADVASSIDQLSEIKEGQSIKEAWPALYDGTQSILALLSNSIYSSHLHICNNIASEFVIFANKLINKISEEDIYYITRIDEYFIRQKSTDLKKILFSELQTMPCFLVSEKDNYDVNKLIENGMGLFPKSLLVKVPEAIKDAQEAGRAMAFELATGCGFHIFRVTEAVVRRYWDFASGGKPRPKLQTLGKFSAELEQEGYGDKKIIESIKQMTNLHRNPLIHPEVILTVEEAIGIAGMARSVISAILIILPEVAQTTDDALILQ